VPIKELTPVLSLAAGRGRTCTLWEAFKEPKLRKLFITACDEIEVFTSAVAGKEGTGEGRRVTLIFVHRGSDPGRAAGSCVMSLSAVKIFFQINSGNSLHSSVDDVHFVTNGQWNILWILLVYQFLPRSTDSRQGNVFGGVCL